MGKSAALVRGQLVEPQLTQPSALTGTRNRIPNQALATAGAGTITSAMFVAGGQVDRDCVGVNRVDTTDTAVALIAGVGLSANGHSRKLRWRNATGAAFTSTLAGGVGVTVRQADGAVSLVLADTEYADLELIRTSATTCDLAVVVYR